jgi:hypothetical protein
MQISWRELKRPWRTNANRVENQWKSGGKRGKKVDKHLEFQGKMIKIVDN